MRTKICVHDVYGSILATDDPENCLPPRDGFFEYVRKCQELGIILVTSSDGNTPLVKIDLQESGVPLHIFSEFFQMKKGIPKDYNPIAQKFGVNLGELYVFGDNLDIDVKPAIQIGCRAMLLPQFTGRNDDFDWNSLDLQALFE